VNRKVYANSARKRKMKRYVVDDLPGVGMGSYEFSVDLGALEQLAQAVASFRQLLGHLEAILNAS
jgi:hypothetical protein